MGKGGGFLVGKWRIMGGKSGRVIGGKSGGFWCENRIEFRMGKGGGLLWVEGEGYGFRWEKGEGYDG